MKKLYIYFLFFVALSAPLTIAAQDGAGQALMLDGIDDFVSIPVLDHNLNTFTLECWINVPDYDGNVHYISLYQNSYLLMGDYSSGVVSTWADGLDPIDAGSTGAANHPTLAPNEWHHLAFTFDGVDQKIYVDGILVDTQPTTGSVTVDNIGFNQGMNIGARYSGSTQFAAGMIDEVRIWSSAKSETEINERMGKLLVGNEWSLVGYWNFNGNLNDNSGNSQNGSFVGGASLVASDAPIEDETFDKVISGSLVEDIGANYLAVWGDYDNDDYPDLFVPDKDNISKLYHNNGDGTFTDVVAGDLGTESFAAFGATWGDYDNDGFLDLFVAVGGWASTDPNALYHNNGDGTFSKIIAGDIGIDAAGASNATWSDLDNDGHLDLLVSNQSASIPNHLYKNNGDGTFTLDINFGVGDLASSWSIVVGDYNDDGYQDVYVANIGANFMYRNNGNFSFTKITVGEQVTDGYNNYSASWVDYDNDEDLDIIAPGNGNVVVIYRNDGTDTFLSVTSGDLTGSGNVGNHWSVAMGDYNNDSHEDLLLSNEFAANQLYFNSYGTFSDDFSTVISNDNNGTLGSAWADIDLDGDLDLYSANFNTSNDFYTNEGNDNNYLDIKLIGTVSNKSAIGTKIRLSTSWFSPKVKYVSAQDGRGQSPLIQHFGLGGSSVTNIEIFWPSGIVQSVLASPNQLITVEEGVTTDDRPKVLLLAAESTESWIVEVQKKLIATGEFSVVNYIQVNTNTPSTAQLANYDAIIVWSDSGFNDAITLGNNLSEYIDNGGSVITAVFSLYGSILLGDFANNYQLIIPDLGTSGTQLTLGTIHLPDHPLMNQVSSFDGGTSSYHSTSMNLTSGSYTVAEWSDGSPLIVAKENVGPANAKRVDLNFFPPSSDSRSDFWLSSTSGTRMMTNAIIWSLAPPDQFTQQTTNSIVTDTPTSNWGIGWGDIDGNGHLDLYIANSGAENYLHINNGDGTFTKNITDESILTSTNSFGGVWGDYDNDGNQDLFVANNGPNDILYHNNGDGSLSLAVDFGDLASSTGGAWGDYDGDGYLDLFVCSYGSGNFLYHNNQDGTFTLSSDPVIVDNPVQSYHAAWVDYDDDGFLDLFIANFDGPNELFRNDSGVSFERITSGDIVTDNYSSLSGTWGDYDNDADLDLFVANYSGTGNNLYQNNGDGTFTSIQNSKLNLDASSSLSSSWVDFDNDGYKDLFVTTESNDNSLLYRNNGDGTFESLKLWSITSSALGNYGSGWADYDEDGDMDVAVAPNNGTSGILMYENNGNSNNWLTVKLDGVLSNKDGFGAKVYIHYNGEVQFQEISAQTGFGSQNSIRAHFGLGNSTVVDEILINWPSGIDQIVNNVSANQFITITEDVVAPVIESVTFPEYYDVNGGQQVATVTVSDDQSIGNVTVQFQGITQPVGPLGGAAPTATTDGQTFGFNLEMVQEDPLGLIYAFEVIDNAGNVTTSSVGVTHLAVTGNPTPTFPNLKFGSQVTDYQIVSIPYILGSSAVAATFADDLGAYDDEKWRAFHYSNGETNEIDSRDVAVGEGYWLIIRDQATVDIGAGRVPQATPINPYVLDLEAGWNQIGNPYNFSISWTDILADNGNPSGIDNQLTLYNSGFVTSDILKPFQGGFVFADDAISINIPVLKNNSIQGRVSEEKETYNSIDMPNWQVNLNLKSGEFRYELGGFGMNEKALVGEDKFDGKGVPRFIEYVDISFGQATGEDLYLARQIVPTNDYHKWSFVVENSFEEESTIISWDNSYWGNSDFDIYLLDKQSLRLIDMRYQNSYEYEPTEKRNFEVFYGADLSAENLVSELKVSKPYPNPFNNEVDINVELPAMKDYYSIDLRVYNSNGQLVKEISVDDHTGGYLNIKWDGRNSNGAKIVKGIYTYQMFINGPIQLVESGHIVKK